MEKQQMGQKGNTTSTDKKDGKNFSDKVGNVIEKVGHKVSEAGAPGIGQKIHDLGDKMESSHKNPSHPHKT